jgi:hypothetical protein
MTENANQKSSTSTRSSRPKQVKNCLPHVMKIGDMQIQPGEVCSISNDVKTNQKQRLAHAVKTGALEYV